MSMDLPPINRIRPSDLICYIVRENIICICYFNFMKTYTTEWNGLQKHYPQLLNLRHTRLTFRNFLCFNRLLVYELSFALMEKKNIVRKLTYLKFSIRISKSIKAGLTSKAFLPVYL
ncbi:hypothetical protein O3G_MSEX008705 [Manduca sexta]|uniref:Uncharacterized protein n=1 Tax=Manduca sexta TaxID=7130 RepID=A0A921ZAG2_MANSE|nr:hypothetical protein O3G_MSEX008705 [Manduca sexta]